MKRFANYVVSNVPCGSEGSVEQSHAADAVQTAVYATMDATMGPEDAAAIDSWDVGWSPALTETSENV